MKAPRKGIHAGVLVGGFVAAVCLALYPIVIHPYIFVQDYKQVQKHTRKDIDQESIQPGGMKVWSDPFGRK
ncbi:hypothetical protein MRX96_026576 [Rhipicephalus microplus]|uniref:Putative conserved secreted protein n=1 Tax=Rhipicephalus microplus TaxID=6941 RepID=A0A6G5A753_RHIMP